MRKLFVTGLLISTTSFLFAQKNVDAFINAKEVERIERVLASDEMQGRKAFTPAIDRAADFIAGEFAKSKLTFWKDSKSYFQEFVMTKAKAKEISGTLDGEALNENNVALNTTSAEINISSLKDYEVVFVRKGDDFSKVVFPIFDKEQNVLVFVDTSFTRRFRGMQRFGGNAKFASPVSQVFILTTNPSPASINLHVKNELTEQHLKNVVGVLPGKSKKEEYVIFSGHYDHLGIGRPDKNQDSIFNGANDDAAGTTAVIMLANYYSRLKNNERTLVFVAFTAEELGGFGSRYFSKQFNPDKVMAMFNIEMIGTESKWGKNSAYITGYERTDMGSILQKNLQGTGFTFYPDPYPAQNLFFRSDNATLAELGVPAHTISTSKMDSEPNYHKASDQVETLDMENMAQIIKSIALSAQTIINGKDSPTRVKVDDLK
jgi:hypothetical protein